MSEALVQPDKYGAEVMQAAYDAYLSGNFNYERMGLELDVPVKVIKRWVSEGGWRERKLEIDRQLFEDAEIEYKKFVTKNRTPVAERHARISGVLEESLELQVNKVREALESGEFDEKSMGSTLKRLAEALSAVTGVSARAVGMSDKVTVFDAEKDSKGKQPLVTINVTPTVSREREGGREPRDITGEVTVS